MRRQILQPHHSHERQQRSHQHLQAGLGLKTVRASKFNLSSTAGAMHALRDKSSRRVDPPFARIVWPPADSVVIKHDEMCLLN